MKSFLTVLIFSLTSSMASIAVAAVESTPLEATAAAEAQEAALEYQNQQEHTSDASAE